MSKQRIGLWAVLAVVFLAVGALVVQSNGGGDLPDLPLAAGEGNRMAGAAADASSIASESMMWSPIVYQGSPDLPILGGKAAVYKMKPGSDASLESIAAAFGIDGDVQVDGDRRWIQTDNFIVETWRGTYWSMYRNYGDGREATIAVEAEPARPVEEPSEGPTSDEAVAEEAPLDEPELVEPERPANLPSKQEATAIATAIFAEIGTPTGQIRVDDGWSSWHVAAGTEVDGFEVTGLEQSINVGPDGVIEWANGWLGTIEKVGDYPRITTTEAIERLNTGWFIGGSPEALGGVGMDASNEIAEPPPHQAEPNEGAAPGRPTESPEPAVCEVDPDGNETCGEKPMPVPEPMPLDCPPEADCIEPMPMPPCGTTDDCGSFEPPEPTVVVLTGVEEILTAMPSNDGSEFYLVPGYRFSSDDGQTAEVIALPDDSIAGAGVGVGRGDDRTDPVAVDDSSGDSIDSNTTDSDSSEPDRVEPSGSGSSSGSSGAATVEPTKEEDS